MLVKTKLFPLVLFSHQLLAFDYAPRKLTKEEIKENDIVPINSLMTSHNSSSNSSKENIKLKHVAKGTNKEKSWKDAARMPGTNWCGKGWRVDSAMSMGGYAGADRCCRQHDLGITMIYMR